MNEVSIQASGGENTPGRGRASTLADLQSREETAPSGESSADEARDGGGVRGSKRSRLGFWQLLWGACNRTDCGDRAEAGKAAGMLLQEQRQEGTAAKP